MRYIAIDLCKIYDFATIHRSKSNKLCIAIAYGALDMRVLVLAVCKYNLILFLFYFYLPVYEMLASKYRSNGTSQQLGPTTEYYIFDTFWYLVGETETTN